jgi:hypothetical protein
MSLDRAHRATAFASHLPETAIPLSAHSGLLDVVGGRSDLSEGDISRAEGGLRTKSAGSEDSKKAGWCPA